MVEAQAVSTPSAAKPAKKAKSPKAAVHRDHPPFTDMVKKALRELKDRKGSSRQAIIKYVKANNKIDASENLEHHVKRALITLLKNNKVTHTKGIGASGSFKILEKEEKKVVKPQSKSPKKAKEVKRPRSKSPKKAKAAAESAVKTKKVKKPASPKKATVKKSPKAKKPTKPKAVSPKKAKSPSKPKVTKKAASPKKAKK
jgi:histone H1/5